MWRWHITYRPVAATTLRITFWYSDIIRKSISNRSIILKGKKIPVVVSRVNGCYYTIKRSTL
jgi:hypothetical protein